MAIYRADTPKNTVFHVGDVLCVHIDGYREDMGTIVGLTRDRCSLVLSIHGCEYIADFDSYTSCWHAFSC